MRSKTWFLIIIAGIFFYSCLDEIDLPLPENLQDSLVIEGRMLYGEPTEILVTVGKVFDFSPNNVRPVIVRSVILLDDEGNSVELDSPAEGVYQLFLDNNNPQFPVTYDKTYKLRVASFDNRVFETTAEPLLPVVEANNLEVRIIQKDIVDNTGNFDTEPYFQFVISTSLTGPGITDKARVRFVIERTYKITDTPLDMLVDPKSCYITETPALREIKIVDGNELNEDQITDFPVYESRMDYRFAEGLYVNVLQESLSAGAYTYWNQVSQLVNRSGNMFEAPAGKLISNFFNIEDPQDNVFGYFYATPQDTIRVYVSPEMAGNPSLFCPPNVPAPPGRDCPVLVCCDCLSEGASTTIRPSYWVE